jgi:glucose-1-phosphate thymidylyltransferase
MIKNGIILAGGEGTRLLPLTTLYNKHMVPIKNKFIIDYSIETIKNTGITNLTVVLGGPHFAQVVSHLKDGSKYGLNINYCYQNEPKGIAHAVNLCKRFVADDDKFVLMLGDNIFEKSIHFTNSASAQIVLCRHEQLNRFGVASIKNNKIVKIEEKPHVINTEYDNYAITGCYLFDHRFFNYFQEIQPSLRGEYEVSHIIDLYNKYNKLDYIIADGWWSDAGMFESITTINSLLSIKTL